MSSLAGKVALITGGTKGIGRAVTTILVARGARVAVNYGSDSAAAQDLVSSVGGSDKVHAVQADAGTLEGIEKMVQETLTHFQTETIDILIPNAAVFLIKTVESTTEADFDRAFSVNVKGPYFLVQKTLPYMPRGGRVVFLSTTQDFATTVAAPYTLYCSTKGAIDQMTRVMAKDLGTKGINVNAVAPGPTGTDLFYRGKSEELLKTLAAMNPHNKIGEPEDVAHAIVYLCSAEAAWVNGQTLRVNGGMA